MRFTPICSDSYKGSQAPQYPKNTTEVDSYFESRGGAYDNIVFTGLQYIIKKLMMKIDVRESTIIKSKYFFKHHFGRDDVFNEKGWRDLQELNYLPLEICAIPEGTIISPHNVLMTVRNTLPNFAWLTSYMETELVKIWYGCTVSSRVYRMKWDILNALVKSGDPGLIDFMLQNFGYRGASSQETAMIADMAHLIHFKGTDTMIGADELMKYYAPAYPADTCEDPEVWDDYFKRWMPGFSIPAMEHSTVTSWGEAGETASFKNMLDRYPTGMVACVSDSWNIMRAIRSRFGDELREQVLTRKGVLIYRPDSSSEKYPMEELLPELLNIAGDAFGYTRNKKGYKVLDPHVRSIQGDGVKEETVTPIYEAIMSKYWSADNMSLGSGGGIGQTELDRDTCKFAFKCCEVTVDGERRDVYKDPITDPGKQSKRGRQALIETTMGYETVREDQLNGRTNILRPVFKDGELLVDETFEDIRERVRIPV